ncbi:hypothetical protein GGI11_003305 [Coemansia sp. RSA 2049]|nr:hypothetical protein GGI11_003305 [Coemansia sp. RSA 2049]
MLSVSTPSAKRSRKKIVLKPGHSPLDWERLMSSGEDLRGVKEPQRLTTDEISKHNTVDDCWLIVFDRVYNVTRYLDFHPGGRGQIMRAAGKDGTQLFMETHAWVNAERMLRECFVGIVIREPAKT